MIPFYPSVILSPNTCSSLARQFSSNCRQCQHWIDEFEYRHKLELSRHRISIMWLLMYATSIMLLHPINMSADVNSLHTMLQNIYQLSSTPVFAGAVTTYQMCCHFPTKCQQVTANIYTTRSRRCATSFNLESPAALRRATVIFSRVNSFPFWVIACPPWATLH